MTILIVDDDADIRLLASVLLGGAGHSVVEARNGAEAADAFSRQPPDLVLMDLFLDAEDGVQVAATLRGMTATPPPVAFLTAAVRPDQLARIREAAPAGIITKPFDPAGFVGAVTACCAGAA